MLVHFAVVFVVVVVLGVFSLNVSIAHIVFFGVVAVTPLLLLLSQWFLWLLLMVLMWLVLLLLLAITVIVAVYVIGEGGY